jgi:hypothetical protein
MTVAMGAVDASKNGLNLGKLQVLDFSEGGPLEWNAEDPLCCGQVLRMMSADIAKEAVESAQPHVSRAGFVVSARFQVLEEGRNPLGRQLLQRQLTGIGLLPRCELEEELEAVAVAVESIDAHPPLPWKIVGQESAKG